LDWEELPEELRRQLLRFIAAQESEDGEIFSYDPDTGIITFKNQEDGSTRTYNVKENLEFALWGIKDGKIEVVAVKLKNQPARYANGLPYFPGLFREKGISYITYNNTGEDMVHYTGKRQSHNLKGGGSGYFEALKFFSGVGIIFIDYENVKVSTYNCMWASLLIQVSPTPLDGWGNEQGYDIFQGSEDVNQWSLGIQFTVYSDGSVFGFHTLQNDDGSFEITRTFDFLDVASKLLNFGYINYCSEYEYMSLYHWFWVLEGGRR